MTPNERQCFVDALHAERLGFSRFLAILQGESSALLRGDVEELLRLAESKTAVVEELIALATSRQEALMVSGFSSDRTGMTEWLIVHGAREHSRLSTLWNALLADATEARQLNQTNGILIESRLRFNQAALTALRAASEQATLYGPNGSPDFKTRSRALGLA
ncbi:MAG: flagellar protein FlgN [Betaproteobacteria bacterium]|jgi:flagella synthesis protein FlgN